MITATIDAHKRCNVTKIDIPGAFFSAYKGNLHAPQKLPY